MDTIEIRGLRVRANHGVLPHEAELGQVFVIDVTLTADLSAAAASDDLADTISYADVAADVAARTTATRFDLIERLAGHLLDGLLADPRVAVAEVRIAKPHAPMPADVTEVAVRLRRTRER